MAVSTEARAIVRTAFGGRCGYCGVSETSVRGELETDHFYPLSAGGSDDIGPGAAEAQVVMRGDVVTEGPGEMHD